MRTRKIRLLTCGQEKKCLLYENTTKYANQLDHILGSWDQKVFTTSFYNFISDHKTIVLRLSLSDANFIEDERLKTFKDRKQEEESSSILNLEQTCSLDKKAKKTKSTKRPRSPPNN